MSQQLAAVVDPPSAVNLGNIVKASTVPRVRSGPLGGGSAPVSWKVASAEVPHL